MNIKISIEQDGKKAELELDDTNEDTQKTIVQSVFQLFNISTSENNDQKEEHNNKATGDPESKKLSKVEQAYVDFTNGVSPEENNTNLSSKSYISTISTKKPNISSPIPDPESKHWETGIKIIKGIEHFKTRYECRHCGNKETIYIEKDVVEIDCSKCKRPMNVHDATKLGFPNRDYRGMYFRAGLYQDHNEITTAN